jgi:tetratricopeptide (TPR) repeat protein
MRPAPILVGVIALMLLALPAWAGLDAAWKAIPARVPADSLPAVLLAMETRGAYGVRAGEAAYALGQFRYARGEYAAALGPFLRAYARLAGRDRFVARYSQALASLALGNATAARAVFQEVADGDAELRPLALLGVAQSWDAERRPEKAFGVLGALLGGEPGEAGAPALERYAALADQFRREPEARSARARLARSYPRSIEAARLGAGARPRGGLDGSRTPSRLPGP